MGSASGGTAVGGKGTKSSSQCVHPALSPATGRAHVVPPFLRRHLCVQETGPVITIADRWRHGRDHDARTHGRRVPRRRRGLLPVRPTPPRGLVSEARVHLSTLSISKTSDGRQRGHYEDVCWLIRALRAPLGEVFGGSRMYVARASALRQGEFPGAGPGERGSRS